MSKKFTQKEFEEKQKKIFNMKNNLEKIKENNPKIVDKIDNETDLMVKLNALNATIGFLTRKGYDSAIPMKILIEIAEEYEKKLKNK